MVPTAVLHEPPSLVKMLANDLRWSAISALLRSDYRVQELVKLLGQPQNLVSYHLRKLRDHQIVKERRSFADARDVYYSVDTARLSELFFATGDALHVSASQRQAIDSEGQTDTEAAPLRVLFLCTHNSARSQMAEGIMRHLSGNNVEVYSAGTEPSRIHPDAITVMNGMGVDITGQHSKYLDPYLEQHFDYIVTVCDRVRESCPVFPGDPEQIHWSIPDPAAVEDPDERMQAFLHTAHELTVRIRFLIGIMNHDRNTRRQTS